MAIRYTFASGLASEWANSSLILAVGQPGYEVDTGIVRIGDGANLFSKLPAYTGLGNVSLDDTATNGATLWSSQRINTAIQDAIRTAGTFGNLFVVTQNPDGTWNPRPNLIAGSVVLAVGTAPPSWLLTNDLFFLKDAAS